MYGQMYRSAIQEYKASYFRERSSFSMFDSHDKRKSAAVRSKTKAAQILWTLTQWAWACLPRC